MALASAPSDTPPSTPPSPSPVAAAVADMRAQTLALAAPLSAEDQVVQSMPDASPTKWHLGHTTWFFETFLLLDQPGYEVFDPSFGFLFNSYYNAIGERQPRAQRGLLTRPSQDQVLAYRAHVDARLADVLADPSPALADLAVLGIHHEQQHQELILMDAMHLLSCHPFQSAYTDAAVVASVEPDASWRSFEGGVVTIGHDDGADAGFAFDNESPRHDTLIQDFELRAAPVTCGEFAEFIEAGGYEQPEWWLSDGWYWVQGSGRSRPQYWGDDDTIFDLHGRHAIDPYQPVSHVTYFEADAYARWAGARLPTEAEWETAAIRLGAASETAQYRSGPTHHPVGPAPGTTGMMGTLWEWTSSPYVAYPGFQPAAGAVGEYNGKFMNGQYVLRGGSHMTPLNHARVTYRNFFPPHTSWQTSGFRLAR